VSGSATPPASAAPPASAPADAAPVVLADDPPVLVSPADASLDPAETWRRVLTSIESKSMRLGALLAHAAVASFAAGTVTLAFPDKRNADSAEKDRALIETALSSVLGRAGRVAFTVGARPDAAVRSAVARETDADLADRKVRETEARQHPVIRRAQDVFGAPLKEIKT
jgi:signal transduction histidine kinase